VPRPSTTIPVIIEAAINGSTPKARNPHVPITAAEIAADALRCAAAGAAVVHSHIDDLSLSGTAAADRYLAGWRPVLQERPDLIVYPTVSIGGSVAERCAHVASLAASGLVRMGVLDPGSVNLGVPADDGLPGPIEFVYVNSYGDIRYVVDRLQQHRLGPSISIFEPGFLRTALAYHRAGRLPPGAFIKLYFGGEHSYLGGSASGLNFGLPPTRTALDAYLEMLEGCSLPWVVAVLGGDVVGCGLARHAIERGGHVRVGLEDYAGGRTPTNSELIEQVTALARTLGRPVATSTEAAQILDLPR